MSAAAVAPAGDSADLGGAAVTVVLVGLVVTVPLAGTVPAELGSSSENLVSSAVCVSCAVRQAVAVFLENVVVAVVIINVI